jgi:glyoxylase-like metal-dependent hydrolase (beta-lactamase superfamily II)
MDTYICVRCGVQAAATARPPLRCAICDDEREAVNWGEQQWMTPVELRRDHRNLIQSLEPGLSGIHTQPRFAIGQQALLIQTPEGNVLWDCVSLLDDATLAAVQALGGLSAIASSHPHFYGSLVEWSQAFGGIPIYLHAADRACVMRPDPAIVFWEGISYPLATGLTLIHCGGHFAGSTVLHWAAGAQGRGVLCTGDTLHVVEDRRYVTFMYSYVNYIPLSGAAVQQIVERLAPLRYDRIYGCFAGWVIASDAQAAMTRSATRYLRAIGDTRAHMVDNTGY